MAEQAAKIISERKVRLPPVVDRNKRMVGIVALDDFADENSEIQPAAPSAFGNLEALLAPTHCSINLRPS